MRATANSIAAARRYRTILSRPEYLLWLRLKNLRGSGLRIRRQHAIGPYVADFYCPVARLVIEIDGGHHEHSQPRDEARTAYFAGLGLRTEQLLANAVLTGPDKVADAVIRLCRDAAGPSTTQPHG